MGRKKVIIENKISETPDWRMIDKAEIEALIEAIPDVKNSVYSGLRSAYSLVLKRMLSKGQTFEKSREIIFVKKS